MNEGWERKPWPPYPEEVKSESPQRSAAAVTPSGPRVTDPSLVFGGLLCFPSHTMTPTRWFPGSHPSKQLEPCVGFFSWGNKLKQAKISQPDQPRNENTPLNLDG